MEYSYILTQLIILVKILLIGWFGTRFTPIQMVLDILKIRFKDNIIFNIISVILTCFRCLSFWIGLLVFQSFYIAIISSIIAFIYDKKLSLWETKITFK